MTKVLTILLHTKRLQYEPLPEEHKLFGTSSHDSLTDETKDFNTFFIKNNCSTDFIERNTYVGPNDSSNNSFTTTATDYTSQSRDLQNRSTHTIRPYNIRVAHKKSRSLYHAYSLMLRTKTNLKTDLEQFIRSNAPAARPLISVRPAET